jgi:hypothetical protein
MDTLDKNVLNAISDAVSNELKNLCKPLQHCGANLRPVCTEQNPCWPHFYRTISPMITACGEEFYIKCPEFDQLGKVCDFEPAFEAAKLKDKVQQDRLTQLESQVKELMISLKKKG